MIKLKNSGEFIGYSEKPTNSLPLATNVAYLNNLVYGLLIVLSLAFIQMLADTYKHKENIYLQLNQSIQKNNDASLKRLQEYMQLRQEVYSTYDRLDRLEATLNKK